MVHLSRAFLLSVMDKFLVKTAEISNTKKKKAHLPTKITAEEHQKDYPKGTFHAQQNKLFCSSCNVVLDHLRKSVLNLHLESATHKRNAEWKQGEKQYTLKTVLSCKTEARIDNVKTCHEWIRVCMAGNIS